MSQIASSGPSEFYDEQYHNRRHAHLLHDDEYYWARAKASARLYFNAAEQRARVLDFGCGIGQSIAALGESAAGWDVSSEARGACRRRGVRVFESLESVPRREWDIVFCRHALEHMEQPLAALLSMAEIVSPTGSIYLVLPSEKQRRVSLMADLNQHLYCWTFRTINNLLWRARLEPYENRYNYVLGYRALLPLRRAVGPRAYEWAVRATGHVMRNEELIVRARPVQ